VQFELFSWQKRRSWIPLNPKKKKQFDRRHLVQLQFIITSAMFIQSSAPVTIINISFRRIPCPLK
jgi:hypothetical protein